MRPQPESSSQEVLASLVERVTYHNPENGFCVLRAKVRGRHAACARPFLIFPRGVMDRVPAGDGPFMNRRVDDSLSAKGTIPVTRNARSRVMTPLAKIAIFGQVGIGDRPAQ